MIYDGLKFRRTSKVVTLPSSLYEGEHREYVTFGRVVKKWNDPKAIMTHWNIRKDGIYIPVKAIPIKSDGHIRTNMMYGKDGYTYLFLKGQVYIRKTK